MKSVILFFFVFASSSLFAQQTLLVDDRSIKNNEQSIKHLGDSILKGSTDSIRIACNTDLKNELKNMLQSPNTFNYPFDSLKNISKIKSDDGRVRIYTWILPTDSGSRYQFFGFIQYSNPKKKIFKLIELNESVTDTLTVLKKSLTADNWFGALYYKIVEVKNKETVYYTLLGWKGNDTKTTKKIIDVLTFKNDVAVFGAPILQYERKMQNRIVFEYNAQTSMLLHWDEKINQIVFDYLAPANAAFKNQMQTYGATFVYDGLKWNKGKWNYTHDVNAENSNNTDKDGFTKKKNREFYNPEK